MIETTENNAVALVLTGIVQETAYLCGRDIEASTEEMCNCTQEGKCRSMLAMTAELIGFNNLVASVLRGENPSFPTTEQREEMAAKVTSKEGALAGLNESVGVVCAAIESIDSSDWMTKVMAPWGMEVTKAHIASWSALHMMYHDGQINLIQILNGDNAVHWMP